MADYSSFKVPELKKLLAEKKLPQTGNKADLIARLQEEDKRTAPAPEEGEKEVKSAETKADEITYSDDEPSKPAPTAEPPAEPAPETAKADQPAEEPAAEQASFALGLSSTAAEEEMQRRLNRAKRFGLEVDDQTKKLTERAKRFGIDDKEIATGLDSALPERPLKRGRGREGDGRPEKRQSRDRRGGGAERREARNTGGRRGGVLDDPSERAKAEKRAARFATA